jgi:hypothetical protein
MNVIDAIYKINMFGILVVERFRMFMASMIDKLFRIWQHFERPQK